MSKARDERWQAFEAVGPEEVRKRIGAMQFSEFDTSLARAWLDHHETLRAAEDRRKAIELTEEANRLAASAVVSAEEANSLARKANSSAAAANALSEAANRTASDLADATSRNNTIARAAAIIAATAIIVSVAVALIKK